MKPDHSTSKKHKKESRVWNLEIKVSALWGNIPYRDNHKLHYPLGRFQVHVVHPWNSYNVRNGNFLTVYRFICFFSSLSIEFLQLVWSQTRNLRTSKKFVFAPPCVEEGIIYILLVSGLFRQEIAIANTGHPTDITSLTIWLHKKFYVYEMLSSSYWP